MSPLETGFGYLAVAGTAIIWANVSAVLVNRVGVKPVMMVGMSLLCVGLIFFTQVSVDGSYWTDLFPGFLVIGLGMPFVFVPVTIAAVAGVSHDEAGLASGLINTSQQIGGALGHRRPVRDRHLGSRATRSPTARRSRRRSWTGSRPPSGSRRSPPRSVLSRSPCSYGRASSRRRRAGAEPAPAAG